MQTVRVDGLKEVQNALRTMLPDRAARAVMKRVLKKVAVPIAQKAQTRAPKSKGTLKASVRALPRLSPRQRSQHRKPPDDVEFYIGAGPLPQAHMLEFGTTLIHAQPFLRPVWDSERTAILPGIGRLMWIEIQRAAERARRRAGK